jgi:hypothetical protein
MKTTREWYNELPNDIKIKALANTETSVLNSGAPKLSETLLAAFVWNDTPEGMEYWLKIYTDIVLDERIQEEPHTDDVFVDDGNGHDKELVDKFNEIAQGFSKEEMLYLILRYHCDDSDLEDIIQLLIERR